VAHLQKNGWTKLDHGCAFFAGGRIPHHAHPEAIYRPRKRTINAMQMYSWHEALLLGSLLTCTDILSFVHKLKRGGTPQRITSLIEGESLFNYCTCVMIFQFIQYYKEMTEGFERWDYLSLFFEYTVGGIIFGVVAGAIAVYCIKRMIYDGPLAVTLMVIFTYSIYLIA
jgi:NhaP-type Na+/H+ or K+/H+ antiporter